MPDNVSARVSRQHDISRIAIPGQSTCATRVGLIVNQEIDAPHRRRTVRIGYREFEIAARSYDIPRARIESGEKTVDNQSLRESRGKIDFSIGDGGRREL